MPLYEYQCTACAKRTEVLQRYDDAPLAACPACGGAVKKLISSPAFQFKGSGWYVTDYARKGGGAPPGESGAGERSESSAGTAGAERAAGAERSAGSDAAPRPAAAERAGRGERGERGERSDGKPGTAAGGAGGDGGSESRSRSTADAGPASSGS